MLCIIVINIYTNIEKGTEKKVLYKNKEYIYIVMGYKYGVWYVYPSGIISTKHIGHFTVACLMEKEDAKALFDNLIDKIGKINMINIDCQNPVIFGKNIYEDDDNDICSWGYKGTILNWNTIKKITDNYNCNFSQHPHTSIEYTKSDLFLEPIKLKNNRLVDCKMHLVNICSDNPNEWNIIE